MKHLKCENCVYFWKEEGECREHCHWTSRCPGDLAPCDEEEEEDDINDYEEPDYE